MARLLPLLLAFRAAGPLLLGLAASTACPASEAPVARRTLYFSGTPVARIEERVLGSGAGRTVTRRVLLEDSGEESTLTATLDAQGFATAGRYVRGALRQVALAELPGVPDGGRVVLIDLLGHVQPAATTEVTLVDLSSAETLPGRVERRGAEVVALDEQGVVLARTNVEGHRTGPGAFFEGDSVPSLPRVPVEIPALAPRGVVGWRILGASELSDALAADGPGQRRVGGTVHRSVEPFTPPPPPSATRPAPFIESDDPRVVAFARGIPGGDDALALSVRLLEAVHPRVDARKRALPPSAVVMLEHGGDCDGAAALLTAALRARGVPARPVVGYRWVEGRFVPHAWTEVYTPSGWILADAAAPRLGDDPTYLKLFEGLGGALTMGRVLGRLQLEPLTTTERP